MQNYLGRKVILKSSFPMRRDAEFCRRNSRESASRLGSNPDKPPDVERRSEKLLWQRPQFRSVNLNQATLASAWTASGATIPAAAAPKNFARLHVASDAGENLYVTGRFLPSSDTSAWARLGYICR